MPEQTLTFSCTHCGTRLTVSASLAGVTGPCPNCRAPITAPFLAAKRPEDKLTQAYRTTAASSAVVTTVTPGVKKPPPQLAFADAADDAAPFSDAKFRPEPRSLPKRPQNIPLPVKHSTSDERLRVGEEAHRDGKRRPFSLLRALLPVTFLTMAVTVVGALLYFYAPGSPGKLLSQAERPLNVQSPPKGTPPAHHRQAGLEQGLAANPARETQPLPTLDNSAETPGQAAIAANELLDAFLGAKNAAARLKQVEPATTEDELAATLLGGELPEVARIVPDLPRQYPEERMTEFPFRVSFMMKDAPNSEFAILVRQRGTQPPRVFLPAFLDLVGGRLARFTEQPNALPPARFHVYLEPIDECYEKEIPGADRKFTLKLMTSPVGRETARAYAANASRCRKLVEDPDYPIRWGIRRRATVTVQWNRQEDPARPFLELIDINSPDWNP